MAETTSKRLHVVMLPWCAFGHIIPFFELSKSVAARGVSVSFVSTPRNIQRLPKLPPHLDSLVNLVPLPMPCPENNPLPPAAEATVDLPDLALSPHLKIAYDLLREPFKAYVASSMPDWVIVDFAAHWAADVAAELGVPLMMFSVYSASTLLFVGPPDALVGDTQRRLRGSPETLTAPPEWVHFPSSVAYRSFEAAVIHGGLYGENGSGTTDASRFAKVYLGSRAVCIRSCYEVEGQYLSSLGKVIGRDVIPVGLLLPDDPPPPAPGVEDDKWSKMFKWLDEQKERSVVFVGFGSECKLRKEEVAEIARGLELSELPFLWALRRPSWAGSDEEALPPGYSAGRGKVTMGWAPQTKILGHRAIGGTLFHSGWGSIIESLRVGHSLVVLPLVIDQGLNARFLVEKGLAVEVDRSDDGSFSGESVAKCLRVAMVDEALKAKAREAASVFGDNLLQQHYLNAFVHYLKHNI